MNREHFGFYFDTGLTKSIISLTESKRIFDSNFLFYTNNSDMLVAYQKKLWADIQNNKSVYMQVFHSLFVDNSAKIFVADKDHLDILTMMFPELGSNVVVTHNAKIKRYVKRFFIKSALSGLLLYTIRYFKYCRSNYCGRGVINSHVFVIHHHKFIKYFASLVKELHGGFVFLILGDFERSVDLCSKQGYLYEIKKSKFSFRTNISTADELYLLYDDYYKTIISLKPKCIIIPEGEHYTYEVINEVSKVLKVPTVCIQHGWNPLLTMPFRNTSFTVFLLWGEEFCKILSGINPSQKYKIVGNHSIIKYPNLQVECFVTFFLQAVIPLIPQRIFDDLIELIIALSMAYPQIKIGVREHPSYSLGRHYTKKLERENIILYKPKDYSLDQVLQKSEISASIISTTLIDGIAAETVPLVINCVGLDTYCPNISRDNIGIEVKSCTEAFEALSNLISNPSLLVKYKMALRDIKHKYVCSIGDEAVENILLELKCLDDGV